MNIPRVNPDPQAIDLGAEADGRMRKPITENPWLRLPPGAPYVLEMDRECVERYNRENTDQGRKIDTSLIPEPFIGSPSTTKVVLLSLNPGWDKEDAKAHARPELRAAMMRNLAHGDQEYSFYPLNPNFKDTPCAKWWLKKTRRLILECGLEKVAAGLLVIEWFPYHSKKKLGAPNCESQGYSFQLAKEMLDRRERGEVVVVLMRSKDEWVAVDPRCAALRVPGSVQNPCLTSGNFGDQLFQEMKAVLCNGSRHL